MRKWAPGRRRLKGPPPLLNKTPRLRDSVSVSFCVLCLFLVVLCLFVLIVGLLVSLCGHLVFFN